MSSRSPEQLVQALSALRRILTVMAALAALPAVPTADIRESLAGTDLLFSEPRPSERNPFALSRRPQSRRSPAPAAGSQAVPLPAPAAEIPGPKPPPAPSACQLRLTPDVVLMQPLPRITGQGSCGAEDVVRLDSVVLKDGRRLALAAAATLRCPMAEAVARWIREEVAPAAAKFGSSLRTVVTGTSYKCRGRDRDPGAKLSEHGSANALDLRGVTLANGKTVDFTDKAAPREFRELLRQSACASFTTVLGPGSNAYHDNHIHLDLIERPGGYRVCQWDVLTVPEEPSAPAPPKRPAH